MNQSPRPIAGNSCAHYHPKYKRLAASLFVAIAITLLALSACAQQPSELKLVDLDGNLVLRIDKTGAAFDQIENKVAVVNSDGTFTWTRTNEKTRFKDDPAVKRDNDHYAVQFADSSFDVKPDGTVLLNSQPYWRVSGYAQNDAQRERFMAALVIIPLATDAPTVDGNSPGAPRDIKNGQADAAIRKESIVWIYKPNEIYFDNARVPAADLNFAAAEEFLKRRTDPTKPVYIFADAFVEYGTVVKVISAIRKFSKDQVRQAGFIVRGRHAWEQLPLQIQATRDPDEDPFKTPPDPLSLVVKIVGDQVQLDSAAWPLPSSATHTEAKGTVANASSIAQSLEKILGQRAPAADKTVVIKAPRATDYNDVIKVVDVLKGAGAKPILMQIDDLP